MNPKKLFIFDLDGTLVDAYQAVAESLNFAREKFGCGPVSYNFIKKNIGRGDKLFVHTFFPKEQKDAALELYRQHHKKSLKKFAWLKPDAKRLLYFLKRRKKLVAIASNRPALYTGIILRTLGIKKYMDYVLCADQINSLKPKPKILYEILRKFKLKKNQAVFVGDMDVDLATARRANMDAIFITGGSSSIADVRQFKQKIVVRSLKQLSKLVLNGIC